MIAHARDARIDMLRGVSILLVLLHHFNIPYSLKDTGLAALLGWPFLHALARNGNYGVTMFFVVSGFLITRNALDRWGGLDRIRPGAFYTLRAARILPCLLLALLTVDALALAGVQIFGNRADAAVSLWTVNAAALTAWVNVLIVQHGWINYPLGVLWSLSVEMAFYLLFPLACLALRRGWRWPRWRLGSSSRGRCTAWPARARPGRICMAMRPASTPSPWAAALPCWRGAAGSPSLDVRPCARSSARPWRGCTWPGPSARAMCWARPRWRSARPCCCWAGPRRQGACPALARAGRLWSAQLRDLPLPPGGAGPDPGLGAAGAGVGRRAGRVAGGLSGGVLRGRLAGGAVVVGAGQRRAASAH